MSSAEIFAPLPRTVELTSEELAALRDVLEAWRRQLELEARTVAAQTEIPDFVEMELDRLSELAEGVLVKLGFDPAVLVFEGNL